MAADGSGGGGGAARLAAAFVLVFLLFSVILQLLYPPSDHYADDAGGADAVSRGGRGALLGRAVSGGALSPPLAAAADPLITGRLHSGPRAAGQGHRWIVGGRRGSPPPRRHHRYYFLEGGNGKESGQAPAGRGPAAIQVPDHDPVGP
jgi:hypothetical protein